MKRQSLTAFGRQARKRMLDVDITHGDLCKALGCSKSYLTDVFAGRRSGVKYMENICKILRMPYQPDAADKGA